MSFKIGSDVDRFKSIVKNKFKHNLGKFVSSEHLIGQQGNKKITIPISSIDLPRFTYGSLNGGAGQGDGDEGDPIGGNGKKSGKGKAGEGEADHLMAEFTPEELAQLISDELELPKLEDKGKGKIHAEKNKYNKISNSGSESLRHNKRTFKEALKRDISTGTYNPNEPRIIPIRDDKRYKSASTQETPDVNTAVIYMMDVSGSMGETEKHIVKSEIFWIDLLLKNAYKDIVSVFIVHDTKAREVNREEFFKISSAGGTNISSAYNLCSDIITKRHPFSEWNVYPFHFSDGDNYGNIDNALCKKILSENIIPNCNVFSYGQVKSNAGSGDFLTYLGGEFADNDKVTLSEVENASEIMKSIKAFFEKGK